ncbi:MAG: hypothetical protein H6807_02480 [Planctomycetes bacterium]|nr:hypothetical protein [Planctomycetota bacterium]
MAASNATPIVAKLRALRGRIRAIQLGYSTLMFVLFSAAMVVGSFLLDWLFHLPIEARRGLLIIMLGTMAWGGHRFFVRPFKVPLDDESLALLVQRSRPAYGDDLITALQFQRKIADPGETESRELMAAAAAGFQQRYAREDFRRAVSGRGLARPALQALVVVLLLGAYASFLPQHARIWFARSILLADLEWPPDTQLEVTIANADQFRHEEPRPGFHEYWVPEGAVVRVETRAIGKVPSSVRLIKYDLPRSDDPNPIVIELGAAPEGALFEYRFGRVAESFEFYVVGGDDEDEKPYFRINVRTAPRVDSLEVNCDYPDYVNEAGKEDRRGVREYNVVGPKGSRIEMLFRSSTELQEFAIILDEKEDAPLILQPAPGDPRLFVWRFELEDDHFYSYRLIGANGAPSREAPNFNIAAQPDLPPEIAIRMPDLSMLEVSPRATLPLEFLVSDDYRVGTVSYLWDHDAQGDFQAGHELTAEEILPGDDQRARHVFAALELAGFPGPEGSPGLVAGNKLLLALEATDTRRTRSDPEPNRVRYPSLITLNVREAVEIERELMRGQVRIKDIVQRVEDGVVAAREELTAMLGGGEETSFDPELVHALISRHAIMASGMGEAERAFLRVFDGYLYNRLAPSNLTENLIVASIADHRSSGDAHLEVIARVVPAAAAGIDETEAMGKLATIMNIMLAIGRTDVLAIDGALKSCLDAADVEERGRRLGEASRAQQAMHEHLLLLLDKMEAWEDFQDIVQGLKDIIDLEKGLWDRTKKIAK